MPAPLGIEQNQLNLKATTEEGLGFTGSGEGMAAQAICCLIPLIDLAGDDPDGGLGAKDAVAAVSDLKMRLLEPKEAARTRKLYEEAFPEDSREFVDYYYEEVAARNRIYAAEQDGEIRSMVHLNPYLVSIGGKEREIDYLVAVATAETFRHQGLMGSLLGKAMERMQTEGKAFTFLMPAKEEIYRPFGFHFISGQKQGRADSRRLSRNGRDGLPSGNHGGSPRPCVDCRKAAGESRAEPIRFTRKPILNGSSRSSNARREIVAVFTKDGMIQGWCFTAWDGDVPEVREIVVEEAAKPYVLPTLAKAFRYDKKVRLYGCPDGVGKQEKRPLMMGRLLNLAAYVELVGDTMPENTAFTLTDHLLPENSGTYRKSEGRLVRIQEEANIPILSVEEFMDRYPLPAPVFFNEVV